MNPEQARELGDQLLVLITNGKPPAAYAALAPVLTGRTLFRLLDEIGRALGAADLAALDPFLQCVVDGRTMGGWVVVASALGQHLPGDLPGALARCRQTVVTAGRWYGSDILGERVPGPALCAQFEPTLALLAPWRADDNRWVRRTTGVAVHFWAKRSRGAPQLADQAARLLDFLAPLFEEREMDALKGVGWGLKTLGRCYPDLLADWLARQVRRPHRALMLRKALTYLSAEQRARVTGAA